MTAYASRRRRRPHLFVCVMLLVTVTLDTIKRSLRNVIGPDDCPINYVATLAAFLVRLRLQKSDISPSKTQSYPRESNFWATSSLRMVSVLNMTKPLPCLAFLWLRTSNSPAAYVMVLVTTSRLCLTRPGENSSHNKKRCLCPPCRTRSATDLQSSLVWTQCSKVLDHFACSVMPAPMVSEPYSNRNRLMALSSSWFISDEALSDNQRNWTLIAFEARCVVWSI